MMTVIMVVVSFVIVGLVIVGRATRTGRGGAFNAFARTAVTGPAAGE